METNWQSPSLGRGQGWGGGRSLAWPLSYSSGLGCKMVSRASVVLVAPSEHWRNRGDRWDLPGGVYLFQFRPK